MKLRYRIGTRVIYWVWRVLFGLQIEGRENIPKNGGMIVASNHLSNFDPPLVGTAVWGRECYFFSKKEIFAISKFYSWIMKTFNAFEVDTEKPKRELQYTQNLLNGGLGLILFPEGTRSLKKHLLDFNPGIGWIALSSQVPIVPTAIKGTNTSLVSQFFRKNRVCVKFGEPVTTNGLKANKENRELITQKVERRIKELYESISDAG